MRVFILTSARLVLGVAAVVLVLSAQEKPVESPGKPSEPAKTQPARIEPVKEEEAAKSLPAPVDPKTYVLGPEDVISVRVWREPDLSGLIALRPDGHITLPLIGEVQAGGLTPVQLATRVTEKLSQYINRPEVMISVQMVRSKRYYVTGEVFRSGAFPLVVPTTVLEALMQAGGFREFAKTTKITILRGAKRFNFNYKEVIKGKNMSQNIQLENGDYVIVP